MNILVKEVIFPDEIIKIEIIHENDGGIKFNIAGEKFSIFDEIEIMQSFKSKGCTTNRRIVNFERYATWKTLTIVVRNNN